MPIPEDAFQSAFGLFKKKVLATSRGVAFKSFHEGLPAEWESYKPLLRARALELMGADTWSSDPANSEQILEAVIQAIEIDEPNSGNHSGLRNNLVSWPNRFGHSNRSHHKLLDARDDESTRTQFGKVFHDLYVGGESEAELFNQLMSLIGKRYDILAYLFYLKDPERFMPIAPKIFDEAFGLLGLDLVTSHKCSWENYCHFNDALAEVRVALIEKAGIKDARLIDAHSFCWMLVRASEEDIGSEGQSSSSKKDKGRTLDSWEVAVMNMVKTIQRTVKSSTGAPVEKTPKRKELRMSNQALDIYLNRLLEKQEYKCALTGIPLQIPGDHTDHQLQFSPDRIDSDGHYEAGNLQLVCKFINFWKSDGDDEEFRRLLSLVRGDAD